MKTALGTFCLFFIFSIGFSNQINWSGVETLSTIGIDASDPVIFIDSNANVVAIWIEGGVLKANDKPDGGNWNTMTTISGAGAITPCLVVDENGQATAVWDEGGVIKAATKPFNDSWTSSTDLSSSSASSPDLVVNHAGDLVVVWTRGGNIESVTKINGGSWPTSPDIITSTDAKTPKVDTGGTSPNNQVVVVWEASGTTHQEIHSASKLIGGGWSLEEVISGTVYHATKPDVAVDENGDATVLWYKYDVENGVYSNVMVEAAEKSFGLSWNAPSPLSNSGIRNPSDLKIQVACECASNVVAMWTNSYDGSTFQIEASIKTANTNGWVLPQTKFSGLYCYDFSLNANTFGNAFSTYMNGSAIAATKLFIDARKELFWRSPSQISTGNANGFPSLSANFKKNDSSEVAAAWIHYDGNNQIVQAITGNESALLSPTSLNVVQSSTDFDLFTEYYNTLTWVDSTSSNIKCYYIKRNNTEVAAIKPGIQTFVDHNRAPEETVTYSIVTIGKDYSQSPPASITFP